MRINRKEVLDVSTNLDTIGHLRLPEKGEAYELIVDLLMKNMYSNPIGACIRELTANAIDANVDAGKGSIPIEISLGLSDVISNGELYELRIRDFGEGITPEKMNKMMEFGYSTKRDKDDQIGAFGVGLKSFFNVCEQALIKSYVEGNKGYEYVGYRNKEGHRTISLLREFDYENEPLGTEIKLSVTEDMSFRLMEEISVNCCWYKPSVNTNISRLIASKDLVSKLDRCQLDPDTNVIFGWSKDGVWRNSAVKAIHENHTTKQGNGSSSYVSYGGISLVIGGVPYYGVWNSHTLKSNIESYVKSKGIAGVGVSQECSLELVFEVPLTIDINLNSNRENIQMTDKSKNTIERLFTKAMDFLWEKECTIGKDITNIWEGIDQAGKWFDEPRILSTDIQLPQLGISIKKSGNLCTNVAPLELNNYVDSYYFTGNLGKLSDVPQLVEFITKRLKDRKPAVRPSSVKLLNNIGTYRDPLPLSLLRHLPLVLSNTKSVAEIRKVMKWEKDKPFILNYSKKESNYSWIIESNLLKAFEGHLAVFYKEPEDVIQYANDKSSEGINSENDKDETSKLNRQKAIMLKSGFHSLPYQHTSEDLIEGKMIFTNEVLEELPSKYLIYCLKGKNKPLQYWDPVPKAIGNALHIASLIHPGHVYCVNESTRDKLKRLGVYTITIEEYMFNAFIKPVMNISNDIVGWFTEGVSYLYDVSNNVVINKVLHDIKCLEVIDRVFPNATKNESKWFLSNVNNGFGYDALKDIELKILMNSILVGCLEPSLNYYSPTRRDIKNIRSNKGSGNNYFFNRCLNNRHRFYRLLCNLNIKDLTPDELEVILMDIK